MSHKPLRPEHSHKAGDGWSDGWHTQASAAESLKILGESASTTVRSTAKAASTVDGWKRAGSLGGKLLGGSLALAAGVTQGILQNAAESSSGSEEEEAELFEDGWRWGADGYGYYQGGFRMPGPDDD
ncbi:hypothetical protein [Billgrantia montanilacus]|uniref:hypothetical protein n=1 Tax=Billgrantia montanilacus TaxID=2282305 RepID=UPI0011C05CA0|nr:hypothetical protein [Halomonas montanilacus]